MVAAVGIWLIAWVFIVGLTAEKRGRSAVVWGLLGFLFSFLALLLVLALEDLTKKSNREEDLLQKLNEESHRRRLAEIEMKKAEVDDAVACPMCAETIKSAAKICRFCGHEIAQP